MTLTLFRLLLRRVEAEACSQNKTLHFVHFRRRCKGPVCDKCRRCGGGGVTLLVARAAAVPL
jgi:hypothetical protein